MRYLRHTSGLSAAEWDRRPGVSESYVSYWEHGHLWPLSAQVRVMAPTVGWSAFELALPADVGIPYPVSPPTQDLPRWRKLARDWVHVAEALARFLACQRASEPDRRAAPDPELPRRVEDVGRTACCGWLRQR